VPDHEVHRHRERAHVRGAHVLKLLPIACAENSVPSRGTRRCVNIAHLLGSRVVQHHRIGPERIAV
jgi:hypothetical protein